MPTRAAARMIVLAVATTMAIALPALAAPSVDEDPATGASAEQEAATESAATGRTTDREGRDDDSPSMPQPPDVSSSAYLVHSEADGVLMTSRQLRTKRAIASLTKLMTALVVVERTKGNDDVTVSKKAVNAASNGAASADLKQGATYSVDELLDAMLVTSANDAAVALAEHVAGNQEKFIELMNQRAVRLELAGTTFSTVTGLDTPGNGSTVADLLELARTAMQDTRIKQAVGNRKVKVSNPGGVSNVFENRNEMITTYQGVDGVKTGYTAEAGYSLITHYADDSGAEFFVVQLDAPDEDARFDDARKLLDWARSMRPELDLASAGERIGSAPVAYTDDTAELVLSEDVRMPVLVGQTITERVVVPEFLPPPLDAGDVVGTYEIVIGGDVVASTDVVVSGDVAAASLRDRMQFFVDNIGDAFSAGVDAVTDPFTGDSADAPEDAAA